MSIQQLLLGAGLTIPPDPVYLDDVFHIQVHKGSGATRQITNGIDLSNKGGLLWAKTRNQSYKHTWFNTERGVNKYLTSTESSGEANYSGNGITSLNTDGYTLGDDQAWSGLNNASNEYVINTFRKAAKFFTMKEYTGTGSTQTISHDLGCVPGVIMVKRADSGASWRVYHRGLGAGKGLKLNASDAAVTSSGYWNDTLPTSSSFTVKDSGETNASGGTYIAYLFAGGSTVAESCVVLDGTGDYLSVGSSSDFSFGTGDFTIEGWFKKDDSSQGGFWQIGSSVGGLSGGTAPACAWTGSSWQMYGGGDNTNSKPSLVENKWYHIAQVRSSGVTTMYVDGHPVISKADTANYAGTHLAIGGYYGTPYLHEGKVSNFRVVKGTAVYTSSFIPQYNELENIDGTVLLCCNGTGSTTSSTITPTTITANGNPTVSTTDSPELIDPACFAFGENKDQNLVSCGSYTGTGSATNKEIHLGWEPQWLIIKRTSGEDWLLLDSMRGIHSGGLNDVDLLVNGNRAEAQTRTWIELTGQGFKIKESHDQINGLGDPYVYIAIRRSDGKVQKPVTTATTVFNIDTGNGSSTAPAFDSTFPVDMRIGKNISSSHDWYLGTRFMYQKHVRLNQTGGDTSGSWSKFDYSLGEGANWDSNYQGYMWRRTAGFDVVSYTGNGSNVHGNNSHAHGLGQIPEMIWIKTRSGGTYSGTTHWTMSHKGLNGGTNPWQYTMSINNSWAETATSNFGNTAPTSSHFYVGDPGNGRSNDNNSEYIALLFSSVAGISKVGSYSGSNSNVTLDLGFSPRYMFIKQVNGTHVWMIFDHLRGMGTGNVPHLHFNNDAASVSDRDWLDPITDGVVINTSIGSECNSSGNSYIYYAHA